MNHPPKINGADREYFAHRQELYDFVKSNDLFDIYWSNFSWIQDILPLKLRENFIRRYHQFEVFAEAIKNASNNKDIDEILKGNMVARFQTACQITTQTICILLKNAFEKHGIFSKRVRCIHCPIYTFCQTSECWAHNVQKIIEQIYVEHDKGNYDNVKELANSIIELRSEFVRLERILIKEWGDFHG